MKHKIVCSLCRETFKKLEGNFHKNRSTKSGYQYRCKKCCTMAQKYSHKKQVIYLNVKIEEQARLEREKLNLSDEYCDGVLARLSNYAIKFRWQEEPFVVPDIRFCEL